VNLIQLSETVKRIESLLANALRKAASGAQTFLALRNDIAGTNAAPIAPASTVLFASPAFTPTASGSGKVKLRMMMTVDIAGGTAVAGEQVQFVVIKNGAPIAGGPVVNAEFSATHGFASATIPWEDTGAPGVAVTYGIQCSNITTPAHTQGVLADNAVYEVEERP
jgi:hypothetical protein